NVPVSVGGSVVRPGDVVFADSAGVAFLDPSEITGIAAELKHKEAAEEPARADISQGGSLAAFSGAETYLQM
ncbi:RraA family protein, partial [Acinetobacter baumannii]|nr:RraA family protein [Acinetobacter baumannii]